MRAPMVVQRLVLPLVPFETQLLVLPQAPLVLPVFARLLVLFLFLMVVEVVGVSFVVELLAEVWSP